MTIPLELTVPRTAAAGVLPRLLQPGARTYDDHRHTFGPVPDSHGLITEVRDAGLTGRGGGAFPTADKLAAMGSGGTVIANGAEGEPLSGKDAHLLATHPHLVLDGLLLAAEATRARDSVIVVKAKHEDRIRRALAGRPDARDVRLHIAPDGYVTGEASSLVRLLNGGHARPLDRTAPLTTAGPRRPPTLVQNVETLAHLSLIARHGSAWFRSIGTSADPGSRLLTVTGDVARPGVVEAAGGTTVAQVVTAAGVAFGSVAAVLVGGYHGRWIDGHDLGRPLVARAADARDVPAGAGVLLVLGPGRCALEATARIGQYLAGQSARQCGPCLNGLPALACTLQTLATGQGRPGLPEQIDRLTELVTGRGSCHHPDGTARLIRSALDTFSWDVQAHLAGRCLAAGR